MAVEMKSKNTSPKNFDMANPSNSAAETTTKIIAINETN